MKGRPKIIVSVISDLVTDQRVHKVCTSLHNNGFEVALIGTRMKKSLPLAERTYRTDRIRMIFQKRMWFYAEFNLRLFLKLLFRKADILLGNDLDVMPANFLISKLKGLPLVYDTHEYFLGQPSLQKSFSKKMWLKIEKRIFPKIKYSYTVCASIAQLYKEQYGNDLSVIMNVPFLKADHDKELNSSTASSFPVPEGKFILLLQGAGINVDSGAEELIQSMKLLDSGKFHLLIVGGGVAFEKLKQLTEAEKLTHCVTLVPKVPFPGLKAITAKAHLGFSMDKLNSINQRLALPNKLFDYMHAGVPVLATRSIEIEKVLSEFEIGSFIENHEPEHIADCIQKAYNNKEQFAGWKKNTARAKQFYNWQIEEQKLLAVYHKVCTDNNLPHE